MASGRPHAETAAKLQPAELDPAVIARVESLAENDTAYLSEVMEKIYAGELDHKDKILASMTILTAPATLLVGGIAFLLNNLIEHFSDYANDWRNLIVLLLFITLSLALIFAGRTIWFFNLLLSGENYAYMPYAETMLTNILDLKTYLQDNVTKEDGALGWYANAMRIPLFARAATQNGIANVVRLRHRQGVFRNLFRTIALSALSYILIALHREAPHSLDVPQLWTWIYDRHR